MDWALLKQPNLCEENVILWRVTWIRDICDIVLCPVEFIFITSQEFKIKLRKKRYTLYWWKTFRGISNYISIHPLLSVYSAVVLCTYVDINIHMIQWSEQFSWGYQTPKRHNTAMIHRCSADTEAMRMLHKRCANPPLHTCLGLCTMFWCVMDARNLNWNLPPGKQNTLLTATSASCSGIFSYTINCWF